MNRLYVIVAALLVAAISCSPLKAQQLNWSGVYFGLHGGISVLDAQLDVSVPGVGSIFNQDGISGRDLIGGGQIGFDYKPSSIPALFGVYAQGSWRIQAEDHVTMLPTVPVELMRASVNDRFKLGARLGAITSGNSLVYVGAHYAWANADLSFVNGTITDGDTRQQGRGFNLGLEVPVSSQVTLGLQYDFTRYDAVSVLNVNGTGLDIGLTPNTHEAVVRVNWRPQIGQTVTPLK